MVQYRAEVLDKPLVKVGETEETLQLLHCRWLGPESYCLYLSIVHLDATGTDDVTKEKYGGLVECALFSFEVQAVDVKALQDLSYMMDVFFKGIGVDKDIIDVD